MRRREIQTKEDLFQEEIVENRTTSEDFLEAEGLIQRKKMVARLDREGAD